MSSTLIAITGCIYLYIGVDQGLRGNMGLSLAYYGYAFSNIGLYLLAH